ncbi:MAG: hypothetical protein J6I85_08625 [Clostridia bacterium]|nr:hypothetical protein [Clostridia bacterium]
MKFYRVIYKSIYVEGGKDFVEVKTFKNKELAMNYLKRKIEYSKQDVEGYEEYITEESETSYERYLDGFASQDSVSIWLEEDDFYDEKELLEEQEIEQDNDYEMD